MDMPLDRTAPWTIRISGVSGEYKAEVNETNLSIRAEDGDDWVGTAELVGRIIDKGGDSYASALTLLTTVLLNRADGMDDDHWYVDTGDIMVRIEPTTVEVKLGKKGAFRLHTTINLAVMIQTGDMSEEDLVREVMNYVFSDTHTEVTESDEEPPADG